MISLSRMMSRREAIKNNKKKKKIELNNRTGIFCELHTALQWNLLLLPSKNVGSIRSRSVNDPITTLPFGGVKKYYDGSVTLYIYFLYDSAIPKFLFDAMK